MADADRPAASPVLDVSERVAEVLFGLIMALTITGTIQVSMAGRDEVLPVLVAALGCNLSWGFVDGVIYVVQALVERGRERQALGRLAAAASEADVRAILGQGVPPQVVALLRVDDLSKLRALAAERVAKGSVRVTPDDLRAAFAVCVLVVAATFPVVLPYLLFDDVWVGKRVSNAVSVLLLYACGHVLARFAGGHPVRTGLVMVGIGVVLVVSIMALGG